MEITIKRMNKVSMGRTRAFVDAIINGLSIHGFKVIEGNNGLFVSNPSEKTKLGKYSDTVMFVDMKDKEEFQRVVLEHYNNLA